MTTQLRVGMDFAGYHLIRMVSRTNFSEVFVAEELRLGREIALKVLDPEHVEDDEFRERFVRESRIVSKLHHSNVIPIYNAGPMDDRLFISMHYVDGPDLAAVLHSQGRLSPEQTVALLRQAGRALDAAHRADLVHRDVKPANILIERGDEDDPDHVYLTDFGITKNTHTRHELTKSGAFLGTIQYVSPEQIGSDEDRPVDGRADVYALGCVMYHCLTGQVPFPLTEIPAILNAHLTKPPPYASATTPSLPPAVDAVIIKALAKNRDDRYETCREFMMAAIAAFGWDPQHLPTAQTVFVDQKNQETTQSPRPPLAPAPVPPPPAPEPASHDYEASAPQPSQPPAPVPVPVPAPPGPGGGGAGDGGGWPPQRPPSSSNRWPLVAAVVAIAIVAGLGGWYLGNRGGSNSAGAATSHTSTPQTPGGSSPGAGSSTHPSSSNQDLMPLKAILTTASNKKRWACTFSSSAARINELPAPLSAGLTDVATCRVMNYPAQIAFVGYEYDSKDDLDSAYAAQLHAAGRIAVHPIVKTKKPLGQSAEPGTCTPGFQKFRTEPWEHVLKTPVVGDAMCFTTGTTAYLGWTNIESGTTHPFTYGVAYAPIPEHNDFFYWWGKHHHDVFGDSSDMDSTPGM